MRASICIRASVYRLNRELSKACLPANELNLHINYNSPGVINHICITL